MSLDAAATGPAEAGLPSGLRGIPRYASTRLIAYLGNKRALLPYLARLFSELEARWTIRSFLDPFAGSGAVSRLARCFGHRVMASDVEEYSRAVNACWLGISEDEREGLFAREGGVEEVLRGINRFHPERGDRLPPGPPVEPYIAWHYAPVDTGKADWRSERLFYTRENAVFLDRAREHIERLRPPGVEGTAAKERDLLLGCLLYEAATHANTSGVFKAFHKGFGGHGRDALRRILSPMELEPPLLWPGPGSEVGKGDAASFCASRPADLCYLDPPYNQHQYGSNYHLLNTLARWDREPVSEERDPGGALLKKAGIPETWKESRSAFCSRSTARRAFRDLFDSIDARVIALSYNSEGIVPPAELYDLLADRAKVELRSVDYVKYRGGRQSSERVVRNREILFVAWRLPGPCRGAGMAAAERERALEAHERAAAERERALAGLGGDLALAKALSSTYDPVRLAPLANRDGGISFIHGGIEVRLPTYRLLLFERGAADACSGLAPEGKLALAGLLAPAALRDNREACAACAALIETGCSDPRLGDLAARYLRKLAHRKYRADFLAAAERLRSAARGVGSERLLGKIAEIERIFSARIAAQR